MKKNSLAFLKKHGFVLSFALASALFVSAPSSSYAGFEWRPPQDIVSNGSQNDSVMINRQESNEAVKKIDPVQVQRSPLPQLRSTSNAFGGQQNSMPMFEQQRQPQQPSTLMSAPSVSQKPTMPTISGGPSNFDRRFQSSNPNGPVNLHQATSGAPIVVDGSGEQPYQANAHDDTLYEVVEGFGRQIPLSIALRQIAPVEYEFLFEDGVDAGQLVNWSGGDSWQTVLGTTLSRQNLSFSIRDNVVTVFDANSNSLSAKEGVGYEGQSLSQMRAQVGEQIGMRSQSMGEPEPTGTEYQNRIAAQDVAPLEAREVKPLTKGEAVNDGRSFSFNTTPNTPSNAGMNSKVPATVSTSTEGLTGANDPALMGVQTKIQPAELPTVAFQKPKEPSNRTWFGAKGASLRDVLMDWSTKANVELYWDSEFDYPLKATVVVSGTFEEAVEQILVGFDKAQPRPLGRLHKNNSSGPPVLVVEANDLIQ